MAYNDTIAKTIRKQIALNSGHPVVTSQDIASTNITGGTLQWVDSNTRQPIANSGDASSWLLANRPATQSATITAENYNRLQGIFKTAGVSNKVAEPLVAAASYYIAQTGKDPNSVYDTKTGYFSQDFLSIYNSLRHPSSQVGIVSVNPTPAWKQNPLLRGSIAEAVL